MWALSGDPSLARGQPSNLGVREWAAGRSASSLGPQKRSRSPSGKRDVGETRVPSALRGRAPGRGGRLPLPSLPPLGTHRPAGRGSLTVSASLRSGPAPAPLAASRSRSPPAPSRQVLAAPPVPLASQAAAARTGHGRWTSRWKVSSEERGGTGRGGAGRGRRGGKGPAEEGERRGREACGRPPQETTREAGSRDPPPGY